MSIYKRKKKYWVGFRVNGKRYRKVSPDNSLAGAKVFEAVLRRRLANGEDINKEPKKDEEKIKFKVFAQKWFDVYVKNNNKASVIKNKKYLVQNSLIPFFGHLFLQDITMLKIEEFKAYKSKGGVKNKTINNHLTALSKCLKTAVDWELTNKAPKVKLLKVQPSEFDYLTVEECSQLINSASQPFKDMILVAIKTGLRFGELTALKWGDINFKENIVSVHRSIFEDKVDSTKSNKTRYIPMLEEVGEILRQRTNKTGFIFSDEEGTALRHDYCRNNLIRICKESGMRQIGWHVLRHTFASHLAEKGVSMKAIQELMGHADMKTTLRYAHLGPSILRYAIRALETKTRLSELSGHNMATPLESSQEIMSLIPVQNTHLLP